MFDAFRRLTTAGKLRLCALSFALPIAVLWFFMDISFVYDINIAKNELTGCRYNRPLITLLKQLPEYRHMVLADESGASNISGKIDETFADLEQIHKQTGLKLRVTNAALQERGLTSLLPGVLHTLWDQVKTGEWNECAYDQLIQDIFQLIEYVADTSEIRLDPVLDSAYLGDLTTVALPEHLIIVSDIAVSARFATPLEKKRSELSRAMVVLLGGIQHIKRDADIALVEDRHYYTTSQSLQTVFRAMVDEYAQSAFKLERSIQDAVLESPTHEHYIETALIADETFEKAAALLLRSISELEVLLQKRIDSYKYWRKLGMGSSALAIIAALLFTWMVGRGIARSVVKIAGYANKVGQGDYDTPAPERLSGEFSPLSRDIQVMVTELKMRLALNQGILESIKAPFLVVDLAGNVAFINSAMCDVFAKSPQECLEMKGNPLSNLCGLVTCIDDMLSDCLEKQHCVNNAETKLTNAAGRDYTLSVTVSPLVDQNSRVMGASLFIFDLTKLKQYERLILEKNEEIERLASFPRESPSPVLAAAPDGKITYANLAAFEVTEKLDIEFEAFLPKNHLQVIARCLDTWQVVGDVESAIQDHIFAWRYSPLSRKDGVQIHAEDVTLRKRMEEQLRHDAFHDALTGLPNRALFMDRLAQALATARVSAPGLSQKFAVMFLDVDRFKNVNDSLGHVHGDTLLQLLAQRINLVLSSEDTLARIGGDEYTVLIKAVLDDSEALAIGERILSAVNQPFQLEGYELFVTASVGVVVDDGRYETPDDLLRDADTAMYRAKGEGKARCELFDAAMHKNARERLDMEMALKRAVEREEFVVFYQPLVDLKTGRIQGFEALVRWFHPENGMISPAAFIPLAEETGVIVPMGLTVLRQACHQCQQWREAELAGKQGVAPAQWPMLSVNLSVRQFRSASLLDDVKQVLEDTRFPPELLKLEITESAVMQDAEATLDILSSFKDMGVRLSIDDFGTGYSSLSYLHKFPFDYLKVDQSFVRRIEEGGENVEIVRTIISLAHGMSKKVVAEGIETENQQDIINELGAEYGQGYLFSRPLPVDEMLTLLHEERRF